MSEMLPLNLCDERTLGIADPTVDFIFPVYGDAIPVDHGYVLFSAIAHVVPELHGDPSIGVHPIHGRLVGERKLALTRESRLIVRLPASRIRDVLRLAGKQLDLDGARLMVGVPSTRPLRPARWLHSRLVVIKGFTEPAGFLEAVQRQLRDRGIAGQAQLEVRRSQRAVEGGRGSAEPYVRRTLRIHDRDIVGYAVRVGELDAADSLRLQAIGVGGRRRFGCGIFVPLNAENTV
ncbi:MAG: hypothetical protein KatS3mg059_1342 [Thermomicrobiales bacterium]|nr:MAG: hypothetical protein KatS3mg059_1342 [Thermomicrobiales bacterium]